MLEGASMQRSTSPFDVFHFLCCATKGTSADSAIRGIRLSLIPQSLYDGYEGGLGFTKRALDVLDSWLRTTARLLSQCPCPEGCPSCVQDPQCGSGNQPLDKQGAQFLLSEGLNWRRHDLSNCQGAESVNAQGN
ncbi:MAG: DUF1998 domain-containing protein [Nitrospirae bacterium]|nr:MAG: DUF1998 domain-containing protein [Nitrospirota bacterium]